MYMYIQSMFGANIFENHKKISNESVLFSHLKKISEQHGQVFIRIVLYISRRMGKPTICICENKDTDQTAKLISTFVFSTRIVQFLYYINPKFQTSNHLL